MGRIQYEELPCPFCEKGRIACGYVPSAWSFKAKRTKTLPGGGSSTKSQEVWLVQSGCSVCGKSREEVEAELKRKNMI
jgi:hypothetical protein